MTLGKQYRHLEAMTQGQVDTASLLHRNASRGHRDRPAEFPAFPLPSVYESDSIGEKAVVLEHQECQQLLTLTSSTNPFPAIQSCLRHQALIDQHQTLLFCPHQVSCKQVSHIPPSLQPACRPRTQCHQQGIWKGMSPL